MILQWLIFVKPGMWVVNGTSNTHMVCLHWLHILRYLNNVTPALHIIENEHLGYLIISNFCKICSYPTGLPYHLHSLLFFVTYFFFMKHFCDFPAFHDPTYLSPPSGKNSMP